VTRYRIDKSPTAVAIQLTQIGGKHQQLIRAFQECAEGSCSCPTEEYDKVASMQISGDEDRIDIRLEAKPGSDFDARQIAYCLDHTLGAVDPK
jgi:hypothetical protein